MSRFYFTDPKFSLFSIDIINIKTYNDSEFIQNTKEQEFMLKIICFTDKTENIKPQTLVLISELIKTEDCEVIFACSDTESLSSNEFDSPFLLNTHTAVSDKDVFSSDFLNEDDIILPVFSGDIFSAREIRKAYELFSDNAAAIISNRATEEKSVTPFKTGAAFARICFDIVLIRFSEIKTRSLAQICFEHPDEARAILLSYACLSGKEVAIHPCSSGISLSETDMQKLSAYTEAFFAGYEALGSCCLDAVGYVPNFIQHIIGYQLLKRFNLNRKGNVACPELCEAQQLKIFLTNCQRILTFVDSSIFMHLDKTNYMKFPKTGISLLCNLKKGSGDMSVSFDALKANNNIYCCIDNFAITSIHSNPAVIRRAALISKGYLHFRIFTNGIFEAMGCELEAFCDGKKVSVKAQKSEPVYFFNAPVFDRTLYAINIPEKLIHRGSRIELKYSFESKKYPLTIDTSCIPEGENIQFTATEESIIITDRQFPDNHQSSQEPSDEYSCLLFLRQNNKCEKTVSEAIEDIIASNTLYSEGRLHIAYVADDDEAAAAFSTAEKNIYCYTAKKLCSLRVLRNIILRHNCDLVTSLTVGDVIDDHYFDDAVSYAATNDVCAVLPFVTHDEEYIGCENYCISLSDKPSLTPVEFAGAFFKKDLFLRKSLTPEQWSSIVRISFDDERQIAAFCLLTLKNKKVFILNQHSVRPFEPLAEEGKAYTAASDKNWYFKSAEDFFLMLQNLYQNTEIPLSVQYILFKRLLYRLRQNENLQDRHVITSELLPAWEEKLAKICQRIDDEIIADVARISKFHAPAHIARHLLQLKHKDDFTESIIAASQKLIYEACGCQLFTLNNQKIKIEVMDYDADGVILDCSTTGFFERLNLFPQAELNNEKLETESAFRYTHSRLFSKPFWSRYTFRVRLPFSQLNKGSINFFYSVHGRKYPIMITTGRYTSKLCASVPGSYWICKDFIFSLDKKHAAVTVENYSKALAKMKEEKLQTLCVKNAPYYEQKNIKALMKIRSEYFASRKKYKGRNIWITYDKLYKAGDNADYFFRYATSRNSEAEVHYVVNKGYPDAKKLVADKLDPLYFQSTKHILHFLNSSIVATTHANIPVFSGVATNNFKYIQDLFNADAVCIQHGLAVQWMPHNLHSGFDNIKRFYCATQSELDNLSNPEYDYPPRALRMTGLARYDGLINRSKRQILISPTWRSYIAMPSSAGNTRPYSETFRETEYYRIYNSLINNAKLSETAKRCNYHIIYLLHPTLSNQAEDFTPAENIEVRSPVGESYEKIMTESDLMITDFSGIQFDFAYMRKPLVYYHPDELPAGYDEGGFSYEEQAFGPICKKEDELVDTVCRYMENECQTEEFYLQRQNSFFTFSDHSNCERIYNDLLEFSRQQKGKNREVIGTRFSGAPSISKDAENSLLIKWTAPDNASAFEILYSREREGFYKKLAETDADARHIVIAEEYKGCYIKIRALFAENKVIGNCSDIVRI